MKTYELISMIDPKDSWIILSKQVNMSVWAVLWNRLGWQQIGCQIQFEKKYKQVQ